MEHRYSSRVSPPASFLTIQVSASENSEPINVPAMVDTGADNSAVPSYAAGYLKLEEIDTEFTRGILGPGSYEAVYRAFISIDNRPAHDVKTNSFDLPFAILGRDVLNLYHITLDGPNQTLTITR